MRPRYDSCVSTEEKIVPVASRGRRSSASPALPGCERRTHAYLATADGRPDRCSRDSARRLRRESLLTWIDRTLGPLLAALPCELVWSTTWEDEANASVAPLLVLPLPQVVTWPDPSQLDEHDHRTGRRWKARHLVTRTGIPSPGSTTRSVTRTGTG